MWFLTVFGLMCRSAAIKALSLPFAISFSTWSSRAESSDWISSASRREPPVARNRCSTFAAIVGEIRDSPIAADRMPQHQVGDRGVLQQVAARAGEDRVHHVVVLVGDRQHEHPRQRRDHRDLPGRLDAADARHVQVHDDDVGRELAHRFERVGAVVALAHDLDLLVVEQVAQPRAKEVVVVHEQDARDQSVVWCFRVAQAWAYLGVRASSSDI